jgi:chromosome segregation ATPase
MDLEFSSKIQVKEADVARMQQEIKDLSHQLDEGRKQWSESKKTSTDQLSQANNKIKHLEEMLGRLGVKELEIGSFRSTTREAQLEQQISKLQSDALTTTQRLSSIEQSYADLLVREMGCKRLIAACCNLPLDKVDEFIEPLTIAVENDPPDMDFARVIGFMEKLRQHQQ